MANLIENNDPLLHDLFYSERTVAEQAQIDALIEVSSQLIERRCNRIFAADDYVDEIHSNEKVGGLRFIYIRNPPINSLTAVKYVDYDGNETTQTLTDYRITDRIGEILAFRGWPAGYGNILISYNGGYDPVPNPIKYLCAEMVKSAFDPKSMAENLEFEKLGEYFYKFKKNTLDKALTSQRSIIDLYRVHHVCR